MVLSWGGAFANAGDTRERISAKGKIYIHPKCIRTATEKAQRPFQERGSFNFLTKLLSVLLQPHGYISGG